MVIQTQNGICYQQFDGVTQEYRSNISLMNSMSELWITYKAIRLVSFPLVAAYFATEHQQRYWEEIRDRPEKRNRQTISQPLQSVFQHLQSIFQPLHALFQPLHALFLRLHALCCGMLALFCRLHAIFRAGHVLFQWEKKAEKRGRVFTGQANSLSLALFIQYLPYYPGQFSFNNGFHDKGTDAGGPDLLPGHDTGKAGTKDDRNIRPDTP